MQLSHSPFHKIFYKPYEEANFHPATIQEQGQVQVSAHDAQNPWDSINHLLGTPPRHQGTSLVGCSGRQVAVPKCLSWHVVSD